MAGPPDLRASLARELTAQLIGWLLCLLSMVGWLVDWLASLLVGFLFG